MASEPILAARARWGELIEQIHSPAVDDHSWSSPILDSMRSIFPRAVDFGFYVIDHSPDASRVEPRYAAGAARFALTAALSTDEECLRRTFLAVHFSRPVITHQEAETLVEPPFDQPMRAFRHDSGLQDAVALVAHPAPGCVLTMGAMFDRKVELDRRQREVLTRVVLHFETGYRARKYPASIRAEIDRRGRLIRHDDRPMDSEVVTTNLRRVDSARSRARRECLEAVALWPALVAGTLTLAPRPNGGYFLVETPASRRALRALDTEEAALLALLARGASNKIAAYAFGVGPSTISERLVSIAAKLGVASRIELLRVAALLGNDPRSELPTEKLTTAEREVLALVERGLSNERISLLRGRSVRTIANQVASLLRKTGEPSRRALAARATPSVHDPF